MPAGNIPFTFPSIGENIAYLGQQSANLGLTQAQTRRENALTTLNMLQAVQAQLNIQREKRQMDLLAQLDAQQTGGAAAGGPASLPGGGELDADNPLVQALSQAANNVRSDTFAQKVAYASGDLDKLNAADRVLNEAQKEYREAQDNIYKEVQRRASERANVLAGVKTTEDLHNALNYIRNTQGDGAAQQLLRQLPPGPQGFGLPVLDAQTKAALAPIIDHDYKVADQVKNQRLSQEFEQKQHNFDRTLEERYYDIGERNRRAAAAQAGANARNAARIKAANDRLDKMLDARGDALTQRNVGADQKVIDQAADKLQLPAFQHAYDVASSVLEKMTKYGYRNGVSVADAQVLERQFEMVQQNFKGRQASRWIDERYGNLSGFFQKAENFFENFGRGNPRAEESVMRDVIRAIQENAQLVNAQAVKEGLQVQETHALKPKSAPNQLRVRGSIEQAVASHNAQIVVDKNGNRYLHFYGDPDRTVYRIYQPDDPLDMTNVMEHDEEDEEEPTE